MPDAVTDIIAYHDRTKHHPEHYARGPGGLDWATQPNPFRRYDGSPVLKLPLADHAASPPAAVLFGSGTQAPQPLTLATLGLFFKLSLGLSARKQIADMSWYLRMNPSSGNLYPTEAYAILPALAGLSHGAGVYHYAPLAHGLEQRARQLSKAPADGFWVGLTSIPWREAWKYGERAYRYCQHDVGHALAAIRYAAAVLGWRVQLMPAWSDVQLSQLLGLDRAEDFEGAERETPELLVWVSGDETTPPAPFAPPETLEWFGRANQLSRAHVAWPVIDEAIVATERKDSPAAIPQRPDDWPASTPPTCVRSAAQLIRQRRSAVSFDGVTSITREKFLAILDATLPRTTAPPFDGWPFSPRLHLIIFVHRVTGLDPGLYLWLRDPKQEEYLRQAFHGLPDWEVPMALSPLVPLRRLKRGDLREFARITSCHQAIAADGAFSLGMLAQFEPVLRASGATAWRELFWEAGMIGQALYLAAEAAGMRGTGIGCYFDDVMHRMLGLTGHDWQSVYHFTVGQPVEDLRLRTAPPYESLHRTN